MFMLGGKLSAMSEMEKRKGRVLEQNLGSTRVQLRARIRMSYYQMWLIERQIEVQQRTMSLLNDLEQTMQPHVLTNRMRQADLYTIQAEVASEKAKLNEMKSKRAILQNDMNSLLGRNDLTQVVEIDSVIPSTSFTSSEFQLTERVKQANPSLIAMDRMKEMNR
jgi:outer membrane protein TolC